MGYWRSGTFWASAIFGWFVTWIVLAFLVAMFGSDQVSNAQGITILMAEQLLSLVSGYAHGRRIVGVRTVRQFGFPVIMKDDSERAG